MRSHHLKSCLSKSADLSSCQRNFIPNKLQSFAYTFQPPFPPLIPSGIQLFRLPLRKPNKRDSKHMTRPYSSKRTQPQNEQLLVHASQAPNILSLFFASSIIPSLFTLLPIYHTPAWLHITQVKRTYISYLPDLMPQKRTDYSTFCTYSPPLFPFLSPITIANLKGGSLSISIRGSVLLYLRRAAAPPLSCSHLSTLGAKFA
ncbi:hypothetical protein BKA64DRAFT_651204 [Cadophora sp. MPI-SDFR-AT-0126]|nr:hypothetical protein BKA64DRAFT_651204 [Leotiomycetes sp. MPI-SDFR-AT-0126]